ncbi:MAG: peptidase M24 [Hyphomicrobiales bacterium]|nr:MAG: peptidase M24 [Hyphomicrobiales bacterium]
MSRIAPERGFPTAEFEARLERAQRAMAAQDLDGLLLTTEPEVRYFTGFLTLFWQSPTRPWFLFVPKAGKPVAVIPEIGAALMRRSWLDDIRTWPAPRPDDDGLSLLADLLGPINAAKGRIGLMKGHETHLRMPLADFERLTASLPDITFTDATALVRGLRMVKSEAEIAKLAHICDLVSAVFEKPDDIFHEGQPLVEAFRAFRIACLQEGADDVPYLVGGAGPGGYGDIISPPSERPLAAGDILMLDTGAVFDGYFCDFDRNYAIGRADDLAKRAYDTLHRAMEAGLAAARPGTTCRDLFRTMHGVISEFDPGGGDVGRYGHGLGMQLTEWPSHAAFDDTVLREGMVITLEPSLSYGDGLSMVLEENLVIRDGAPQLLTRRAPNSLPII